MSKHIKIDQLSAYLDGEAIDPQMMDLHFDSCDDCREKLAALRQLSATLQKVPESDVHPAFAQRVIATITEQESTREHSGILRWVYRTAPIAVAALLILAVSLNRSVDNSNPIEIGSASTNAVASILEQDEDFVLDQLNAHFAMDSIDNSIITAAYQNSTREPVIIDSTLLVLALGDTENRVQIYQQWPANKDVRTTISHLSTEESNLFRQMLVVHAQETVLGEASFEG